MSARSTDFSQAKCREWSQKGAYPRTAKISVLMSDPAFCTASSWPPTKNFYCLMTAAAANAGNQQQLLTHFAESLRLLGWSSLADASEAAATMDRLEQPTGNSGGLLIASPEIWTALRQRRDTVRFATCLAYWEQRLTCFETYWQLHEALEAYEQGLRMFANIGLLADSARGHRVIGFEDIMLPTVNLSEVWGCKLARFLKAHETFRLRRTAAAPGLSLACCEELEFTPGSEKSGRKRLAQLDTMRDQGRSDLTWSGLILQACPTNPMLVIGRQFRLETFLLLAPRRNSAAFGFAAFLHLGLVRIDATECPDESQHDPVVHDKELNGNSDGSPIKLKLTRRATFTWLPEQLSDYLHALEDDDQAESSRDWLISTAYPQISSACAYISAALGTQHLLDSPYTRFQLLRLSFIADADSRRVRLDDFSQRTASDAAEQQQQQQTLDFCESLVLPRVFQESALIVAELLVRSSGTGDIPARSLVAPHNMKLVYDSLEPGVQRDLLLLRPNR